MANQMGLHVGCLLLVVAVALLKGAAADNYTVGDDLGWTIPPAGSIAYKTWANKKSFQIGDTIVFNWTGNHNVGGVASKEEYDKCTDPGIVFGPGVRIEINSTDTLYFICTVGDHCERGQKVTITVGSAANNSSPPPPPPPPSYASSLTPTTLGSFFGLIISTLVAISFLDHS
ncbi:PREDICTED: umecyanin-like isoform X2 [Prunus mume]|uniref:Umecyanin-like isoform X2 n=1 Tax=Prunus mume TaxID=102107 RepID=A0ABM1LWR1_PRUMU|nr:PREDICTED: umecyanin-like isoform X2 [Prunus mume]